MTEPSTHKDLARELRELRLSKGNPRLDDIAQATGLSRTVLSDTFNVKGSVSDNTLYRLVEYFNADYDDLRRKRDSTGPEVPPESRARPTPPAGPAHSAGPVPAAAHPAPTKWYRRPLTAGPALLALILTIVLSVGGSVLGSRLVSAPSPGTNLFAPTDPLLERANGADPMATRCKDDKIIALSEKRRGEDFLIEMLYSNQCMAMWGRVTRYDGKSGGNFVEMTIYPQGDPTSDRAQTRRFDNAQSVYTPMIVEPEIDRTVCGVATVGIAGKKVELGPPVCA